ncbi:glycosyltransferase family 4 protein [Burkholderia cenocepacia]|uniref:glycosyltransferase family 4 protein n=1 Tax=Burkholderia cenocepacia TaxID=95486 RepID=UPI002ABE3E1B|nr:glycosyltransferase family 1 protein [Burkholderia cenocepacia]
MAAGPTASVTAGDSSPVVADARLLVDLTEYLRFDAGTGIQRITKAFVAWLSSEPALMNRTIFIFLGDDGAVRRAKGTAPFLREGKDCEMLNVTSTDTFFFLDFSPRALPKQRSQMEAWRRLGVGMIFFVHDLLPYRRPEWFTRQGARNFKKWSELLPRFGDKFVCLSEYTKNDLCSYLGGTNNAEVEEKIKKVRVELSCVSTSQKSARKLITFPSTGLTILMVATVEPRKGHWQVLRAFEHLWDKGIEAKLVFIGRGGWGTADLQSYMRSHPKRDKQFFWLESVGDEALLTAYRSVSGVIVASEGEGYGLPLREALYCGKPALARDLPAFREDINGDVTYFQGQSPHTLADVIACWMETMDCKAMPENQETGSGFSYSISEFDVSFFDV